MRSYKGFQLVDSHCHLNMLDLTSYDGSMPGLIEAAKEQGVQYLLTISVDLPKIPEVIFIAEQFDNVFASVGIHPDEHPGEDVDMDKVGRLAQHEKVIAIGETGLDYYRQQPNSDMSWQHKRFRNHIDLAKQLQKPLVIHSRAARRDSIRILQEENAQDIGGVMHCFTEDWQMAKQALDLGFYISMSGIVTFKNAHEVQDVARKVPLDRLLIETDSPFLTPVPYRGKCTNEPRFVSYVAEFLAKLRNKSIEDIAEITTDNFFKLFSKAKRVNHT